MLFGKYRFVEPRDMDVSENGGFSPKIIHFHRIVHYYTPSILGYIPLFLEFHPYQHLKNNITDIWLLGSDRLLGATRSYTYTVGLGWNWPAFINGPLWESLISSWFSSLCRAFWRFFWRSVFFLKNFTRCVTT